MALNRRWPGMRISRVPAAGSFSRRPSEFVAFQFNSSVAESPGMEYVRDIMVLRNLKLA
jgi:hypothetical protein